MNESACDWQGFTCKSYLEECSDVVDECSGDMERMRDEFKEAYDQLVDEYNALLTDHQDLRLQQVEFQANAEFANRELDGAVDAYRGLEALIRELDSCVKAAATLTAAQACFE